MALSNRQRKKLSLESILDDAGCFVADSKIEWQVGLANLIASLELDGGLHSKGRMRCRDELVRLAMQRNCFDKTLEKEPNINQQIIKAPIIICGSGRSGTSLLHRLLAASNEFNILRLWHGLFPHYTNKTATQSDHQYRINAAKQWAETITHDAPELRSIHNFDALAPDEDSFILEQTFESPSFRCWAPISQYMQWQSKKSLIPALKYLKHQLQYLQFQGLGSSNKRWLLKCPFYFGRENELLSVFPDATLIFTHRAMTESIPSLYNFLSCFHQLHSVYAPNPTELVTEMLFSTKSHLAWRETNGSLEQKNRLLHICFKELMQSPSEAAVSVLKKLRTSKSTMLNNSQSSLITSDIRKPLRLDTIDKPIMSQQSLIKLFRDYDSTIDSTCSSKV